MREKILEVKNLTVYYGAVRALENVSFYIGEGEIVALIGPNGAGKSTALKAITGLVKIKSGEVLFRSGKINGLTPDSLLRKGISLVPEGRRIFWSMSVLENLEMGSFLMKKREMEKFRERLKVVFDLFPRLWERRHQRAGTLSSGEQQMLAIGRALMSQPILLLLDEPLLGLSPDYVDLVLEKLAEINADGVTILIVEQNVRKALEICHRGYLLDTGSVVLEGQRESLLQDERINRVLLDNEGKREGGLEII